MLQLSSASLSRTSRTDCQSARHSTRPVFLSLFIYMCCVSRAHASATHWNQTLGKSSACDPKVWVFLHKGMSRIVNIMWIQVCTVAPSHFVQTEKVCCIVLESAKAPTQTLRLWYMEVLEGGVSKAACSLFLQGEEAFVLQLLPLLSNSSAINAGNVFLPLQPFKCVFKNIHFYLYLLGEYGVPERTSIKQRCNLKWNHLMLVFWSKSPNMTDFTFFISQTLMV